ncbi:MAG TPA: ferric iron uptake transcriptional regulator [Gammaproteobacteria bacterium]|nr:ferric iron uptake transcriptional regulator [Gammaproteobacteria bacterium]
MESSDLKKAGLKVTLPRMKILDLLANSPERHLKAEDIYRTLLDAGEDIALATVYRVLTQFEAAGLVTRHHFDGGHAVFELNDGEHHDHLVDIKTGRVVEFYDEIIEKRQKEIARKYGFTITEHTMILYGHFDDEELPTEPPEKS